MEGQEQMSMQDAIAASLNAQPQPEVPVVAPAPAIDPVPLPEITPEAEIKPDPHPDPSPEAAPEPAPYQFDEALWIKQHFGEDVESVDTIKAKLNAEPTVKEPTFANETSKKIYEALLSGKETEVADYLSKKHFVAALKDKAPEEIVKAGWKTEFGLTDAEANRRFEKQFSIDELADEEDQAYEKKILAKQIEREADNYKKFFSQYEQDIKLPETEQSPAQDTATQVDYTSEAAKTAISFSQQINKPVTDLTTIPFEFSDTTTKLKDQVVLPTNEVAAIKEKLNGHEDKFIETRWFTNGEFNADLFARDVYTIVHTPALIKAALAKATTQIKLDALKENRNYQEAGKVVSGDFEPSEDDKKREWYRKYMM